MPYVNVRITNEGATREQKAEVIRGITEVLQRVLGKNPANTFVVIDEVANPTYAVDLALAIAELVETERFGIYHLVNEGFCSRYAFARYVLDQAGASAVPIEPISSREWQRASQPPIYSALSNHAGALAGLTLRPWQQAVDAFLAHEGLLTRAKDG